MHVIIYRIVFKLFSDPITGGAFLNIALLVANLEDVKIWGFYSTGKFQVKVFSGEPVKMTGDQVFMYFLS